MDALNRATKVARLVRPAQPARFAGLALCARLIVTSAAMGAALAGCSKSSTADATGARTASAATIDGNASIPRLSQEKQSASEENQDPLRHERLRRLKQRLCRPCHRVEKGPPAGRKARIDLRSTWRDRHCPI